MAADADRLYAELMQPIEAQMMRIVARIVHDPEEAADVFQEVLVTIWHKLETICHHPNPQGYILRICTTRSYDALRKRMRRRRREIRMETLRNRLRSVVGAALPVPDTPMDLPPETLAERFRGAVSMLPAKQGQAVALRAIDGASYETIAAVLECSEATARSHFSKGRAKLETIIRNLGVHDERR